jgi:abequosyltransferase
VNFFHALGDSNRGAALSRCDVDREEIEMPTLAICIPTYNRSRYLAELLDSIAGQDVSNLEVVVSDDASPDDTPSVVSGYQSRIKNLNFIRQPVNIGLDRNFLAVVRAASADYVWLMGDDDKLEPGSVNHVLAALAEWPRIGGMTVGVTDFDHELRVVTGVGRMPPTAKLHGSEAVFGSIADLLGFMSSLVVDRAVWNAVCSEEPIEKYFNYYVQVYITGKIIERTGTWGVLNIPCVRFRSSNDQFLSKFGWLKRMEMDVVAYAQIANGLFPHNPAARRAMRNRIFATHILSRIRNEKVSDKPTSQIPEALKLLGRYYGGVPEFWYSALPTLLSPKWLLRQARHFYQNHSSVSGAHRAKKIVA